MVRPRRDAFSQIGRVLAGRVNRHTIARTLAATGVFGVLVSAIFAFMPTGTAIAGTGINQQINFQGKLVNTDGTNVPDGTYNMEFKIYTGGDGCEPGGSVSSPCGGTSAWTEDYLFHNTQGVSVSAGIFQVSLGSITSLPTSIFNNDTIWMSINLGNTSSTCTTFATCGGDGEMLPFIRYTAAPYAFNSLELGGLTASQFGQLQTGTPSAQTGTLDVSGNLIAATSVQAPLIDTSTGTALDIGTGTASSVTIGQTTTPFLIQGDSGTSGSKLTATNGSNTTTIGFNDPTVNSTLSFASTVAGNYTICTTEASTCSGTYATSLSGTYLAKNAADTSTVTGTAVTAGNYLYGFTNNSTATTGGVLNLNNGANTGNALNVTASGNPAASTNALVVVNNTASSPSGNLLDLQLAGVNQLSADYQGNLTQNGGTSTTDTINGQTISAAANFTGTVTAATSVLTPLLDTASAGVLAVGTTNATAIDLNQNTTVATNKSFTANGSALFNDATTSGTAFQIQAAGSPFVTGDTTNKVLTVQASGDDSATLVVANTDGSAGVQIRPGGIGGQNTFVGDNSGALNVVNTGAMTGIYNSGLGYNALAANTSGYANTAVGTDALQDNSTGYWNTALGVASETNMSTGHDNVGIGTTALNGNTAGLYNVGVGDGALYASTGSNNTGIGQSSLYNLTGTSAGDNTALGWGSGTTLTSGSYDTFLGDSAGYHDGNGFTTGTGVQNASAIGYGSQVQASNSVTIGGQGANAVNVGIGTTIPLSTMSVSPIRYTTGTAAIGTAGSSSGTTVTGTGTNWTSDLVGMQFIFADGESGIITAVTNQTSLTVDSNLPVTTAQSYRIQNLGVQASNIGNLSVGVINSLPSAPRLQTASASTDAGSEAATFTNENGNISGQFLGDGTVNLGGNGTTVTYGLTTQGAATGTGFNGMIDAMKFTATASGTMRSLSTYIGNVDPATHNQGQMAIYQDSSGNPGAYLASTSVNSLKNDTWNTWAITSGTATIVSGQSYWMAYWSNENTGGGEDNQYWNAGVSGVSWYYSTGNTFGSGADNGLPASYPAGTRVDNNYDFSIYGTMADSSVAEQIAGSNGATTFKNTADSTTAFQIQNAAGLNVLGVDTSNGQLVLGTNNVASGVNGTQLFEDGTNDSFAGTLKLQGALPGSATYELPNVSGTQIICTTLSTTACDSVYQAAGNYLLQSPAANDASTSSFAGYQYTFTQNSTGAAGNLSLVNAGTNPSLSVAGTGNPSGTNALEVINNTAGTPSGNSLDIQLGGVNQLSVNYQGNITQNGGTSTTDTINSQTISAAASFTGTVTAATSVMTPVLDTASAGALAIGNTHATSIGIGNTTSNIATTITGTLLVKPSSGNDSTTAMTVETAGGSTLLNVDSTNGTTSVHGTTTDASKNAFVANDSSGNNLIQARNDGQVTLGKNAGSLTTLGKTSVGGTNDSGYINAIQATEVQTGSLPFTVSSISVYSAGSDSAPHNHYLVGIYTDSGGPATLVAQSAQQTITAGSWNTVAVSATLSASSTYWIAFATDTTNGSTNFVPYDNTGSSSHKYTNTFTTFSSGLPSSFGAVTFTSNAIDSIYMSGATSGAIGDLLTVNPSSGVQVYTPSGTTTAFQVQNANQYGVLNVDTVANVVDIGNITSTSGHQVQGQLDFADGTADGYGGTVELGGALSSNATYNLPNVAGTQTICTTLSTTACDSVYQPAGSYLLQSPTANDLSTSNFAGYQYSFTQNNTGAAGNLQLTNGGTNPALDVVGTGNPSGTNALVTINNTAGTPSGNSLDIQKGGVNELSVDFNGNVSQNGGTSTTDTINGQTISAAANFTGTVTATTSLTTPSVTSAAALSLTSGGTSALTVDTSGAAAVNIGNTQANAINIGNGSITTAITGSATVSKTTTLGTTGSGSYLKNNGATNNSVCAYTGVSGTFSSGSWVATKTVNDCTEFTFTDTGATSITAIPAPTLGAGSVIYINNLPASTSPISVLGVSLPVGDSEILVYDGTNWTTSAAGSSGAVTLQNAYNNSGTAAPSILTTTASAVTVQPANSGGQTGSAEIFGVHANHSGDTLGNSLLSVTSYGVGVNLGSDSMQNTSNFDLQFGGETNHILGVISATTANQVGGSLTVEAGNANGSSTGAAGGALFLNAGNAAGTASNNGGLVAIQGGTATSNATAVGGAVTITGGSAGATAGSMGGAVSITAGAGTSTGTGAVGSAVNITGGAAGGSGNNAGGNVNIQAGTGTGNPVTPGRVIITGASGSSVGTGGAGGNVVLQGGAAGGSGNNNGGSITLAGGAATGTGQPGVVNLDATVFNSNSETFTQTANNQTFCAASGGSCSVIVPALQTNLDTYGTIVMNVAGAFTGATVQMPTPTNTSPGRVIYVSAGSSSVAFTLAAPGMSSVNMSSGNTATLVWNGSAWSGTTTASSLQQVYNNTSTAPASIITTSATKNILFQAGAGDDNENVFQVGNSAAAPVIAINTTNTATGVNVADNGGVESGSGCPGPVTGWTAYTSAYTGTGTPTICQNTVASDLASGVGSLEINIPGTGTAGANNDLGAAALTANTQYNVSFNVMASTGSPTLSVQYLGNGTSGAISCTTPTNGTVNSTSFFKYVCYFNSGATVSTSNVLRISLTTTGAMLLYVDNLFVGKQNSTGTADSAVLQVGGPLSQGLTLLTLDTFASDPFTGTLNQNEYGSMYYNTTLGRIQCYESDGWGSCGAAPDTNLILEPEYAGAVLNPGSNKACSSCGTNTLYNSNAHIGTMTANICSGSGLENINPTICSSGQEYNYYQWTTSQVTSQSYSIYVKYQLPPTFGGFSSSTTIQMVGQASSTSNASVYYTLFSANGTECTPAVLNSDPVDPDRTLVTTTSGVFQQVALQADPTNSTTSGCTFSPNDVITFRVDLYSANNANAFAGQITFTMLGK